MKVETKQCSINTNRKTRCTMFFPKMTLRFLTVLGFTLLLANAAQASTYYVRPDGGTNAQCTGLSDAAYPGSGTMQNCAFNHPNWVLAPQGYNQSKMVGGDTLIIDGTGGAQYKMGFGSPNTADTSKCSSNWPWDCFSRPIPSGPDAAHPTRILGKGYDKGCSAPPQLWGTERADMVINMTNSSNVELQCVEITDHSDCQKSGPKGCNTSSFPYGDWASKGIVAYNSANVLLKNVNVHGMAHTGIKAARLKDWTVVDSKIIANPLVGWDGDAGKGVSSNQGTIMFDNVKIQYNGCGETYPGQKPYNCYSQSQGGYGDGLGTHETGGNWIFKNSDISHNTSDGIDLLYHNGKGTVIVSRTRTEGNAGNQVKSATSTVIDNSVIIGNCAYFKNNPVTWKSDGFDHCRAFGNSVALSYRANMKSYITNSTITSNGDNTVLTMGANCNGSEVLKSRNNIFIGGPDYNGGDIAGLYYASGMTGNGDGTCAAVKLNDDYSLINGTKFNSVECNGKAHSKCIDPKLEQGNVNYFTGDEYNTALASNSPAIGYGLNISGGSALDFTGVDRKESWDIGARQYTGVRSISAPAVSPVESLGMSLSAPTALTESDIADAIPSPVTEVVAPTPTPVVTTTTVIKPKIVTFIPKPTVVTTPVVTTTPTPVITTEPLPVITVPTPVVVADPVPVVTVPTPVVTPVVTDPNPVTVNTVPVVDKPVTVTNTTTVTTTIKPVLKKTWSFIRR